MSIQALDLWRKQFLNDECGWREKGMKCLKLLLSKIKAAATFNSYMGGTASQGLPKARGSESAFHVCGPGILNLVWHAEQSYGSKNCSAWKPIGPAPRNTAIHLLEINIDWGKGQVGLLDCQNIANARDTTHLSVRLLPDPDLFPSSTKGISM